MTWNVIYDGLSKLGTENQPDYKGYVVRVGEGHWFTYAYTEELHTFWIGAAANEDDARPILERLLTQGWLCEVFVGEDRGHCPESAEIVRHTYSERTNSRVRLLLCQQHKDVFPDWEALAVSEYIRTYNGLEQDAPIIGGRITPKQ